MPLQYVIECDQKRALGYYFDLVEGFEHARIACLHPWEMRLPISDDQLLSCVDHFFSMSRDTNRKRDLLGPINRKIIPIVCFNTKQKPKISSWPNNISVVEYLGNDIWEGKIQFSASPKQDELLLAKGFHTTIRGIQIPKNDKQAVFDFFAFALREVSRWNVKAKLAELEGLNA